MPLTSNAVVECDQLSEWLGSEKLVILMTSMKNPATGKSEPAPKGYIPGARVFDFENEVCDPHSGLPHTMPSTELFERKVSELGIKNDDKIVVYDNIGIYSSPRVWWMFKAMGHDQVYVLNGGLPVWKEKGYRLEDFPLSELPSGQFTSHYQASRICITSEVMEAINDPHFLILDARSYERFYGQAPEPRKGVRSGHIPHSKNLPFSKVLDEHQKLKSESDLMVLFKDLGLSANQKIIFSCGSGVTACILALAAFQCGFNNLSVYDGSWSEWGGDSNLPASLSD